MSKRQRYKSDAPQQAPPEPIDVVGGIPDRSEKRAAWKYVVLVLVFVAWVAFLVYCQVSGGRPQ